MLVTPTASAGSHSARARGRVASISAAKGSPTRLGGAHAAKATVPATRRQGRGAGAGTACTSAAVSLDVGQQRELPRPLDRGRKLALVPRAHPRQAARQDLAALGQEAPERALVLVVEHAHARLAYGTGLGRPSHASSSSISSTSAGIAAGAASGLAGRPSETTTRNRNTASSSFTPRSYSGRSSAAASNCATT